MNAAFFMTQNPITFGSVCSGIEAASVAWHPLGWRAAWLSEIEPFPSAVLAHHYPDVPNLGDMTKLPARIRDGEVVAPDVFCGGTPCQAFSVAGLRKSLDDARGNLSLTFCEIANEIDSARSVLGLPPAVVVWENVPGVLSTADNAFGCFLAGLAGEDEPLVAPGGKWTNAGCVFGPKRAVAWRVFDAQYFGVAQRRRRVFVVASARTGFDPAAVLFEFDGVRRDTAPSRKAGQDLAAGTLRSTDGGSDVDHARAAQLIAASNAEGAPGLPFLTCSNIGKTVNNQTPLMALSYGIRTANTSSNGWGIQEEATHTLDQAMGIAVAHTLRGEGFDASEDGTGRGTPLVPVAFSAKDYGGDAMSDLSPTLRAGGHSGSHANAGVMPAIAFHPSQDPITSTDGSTHALGCGSSGGQASVAVAAYGFQPRIARNGRGDMGDVVAALNAQSGETGKGDAAPCVATLMQVRRLTPTECERLQGFPDGYTCIPWRKKPKIDCPDGPRYKALGNSWAVPNVRWIGRRIAAQLC